MTPRRRPRQPLQGVPSLPGETPSALPSPSSLPVSAGLLRLSHRLTSRDLHLARLLAEHRTLTTPQITGLLFAHPGTARNRLRQLREIGFLDRFTHRTPDGDRVTCWVPGLLSARYTALAEDQPPPTPRAVRTAQDRILANPQLDHLLGVNQFFTDLTHHARTHPGTRLLRWWSAERTAAAFAGRIHPDGHGIWQVEGDRPATVGFWLEHDTGSMPVPRVLAKLRSYQGLQQAGGPAFAVLLWVHSPRREEHLHEALAHGPVAPEVTVATGLQHHGHGDPAGDSWWPVTTSASPAPTTPMTRLPLIALPAPLLALGPQPGTAGEDTGYW